MDLWETYHAVATDHADRPALIDQAGVEVSHGQLLASATRAAAGLHSIGLRSGRHLGVFLPNRVSWVVAAIGAMRVGIGVLGLNTRFRKTELDHLLGVGDVDTVLVADTFLGVDILAVMAELDRRPRLLVDTETPSTLPAGTIPWSTIAETPSQVPFEVRPPDAAAADPVIGFTTSGTTGFPKVAMHTGAQTAAQLAAVVDSFGLDHTTVALVPLPLCGAFGYTVAMATLLAGGTVVLDETWDPDRAAATIAANGVTFFNASDDMLIDLVASPRFDPDTTWRSGGFADFTNAGGSAVAAVAEATGGRTGLAGLYGSSEGFALMASFDHAAPVAERVSNGGYLVGSTMEVRACDPDSGLIRAHGEPGELQFRGPNLITAYLNDGRATDRAFTDDGWYRSGDLGHTIGTDGRGHQGFVFSSRLGDSLRLRGFLCDPTEIENHLERHPSVELAQVVGVTRPRTGDLAVAFVQLRQTKGDHDIEAALAAHCRAGLANYKRPELIVVIDEFPVTDGPNGVKIRKVDLRDRAAELLGPG